MEKRTLHTVVVAPSASNNSLGRALTLADVFGRLGPVITVAADDGALWTGAGSHATMLRQFSTPTELEALVREHAPRDERALIVAVKPFERSLSWAARAFASQAGPGHRFCIDVDDDDAAIHSGWQRALPFGERVKAARGGVSPIRIRSRLEEFVARADLLTVSTWALRERLPPRRGPELRVPHGREARPYLPPTESDRLRIGFFGSPVAYKGPDTLARLVERIPRSELHVLEGTQHAFGLVPAERLKVAPQRGEDTLRRAYADVDIVVLPQATDDPASLYQLPAKLLDALSYGRPVVASATPAIRELDQPGLHFVQSWHDLAEAEIVIERLRDPMVREKVGRKAAAAFAEQLSTEALALSAAAIVGQLPPSRMNQHRPPPLATLRGAAQGVKDLVSAPPDHVGRRGRRA